MIPMKMLRAVALAALFALPAGHRRDWHGGGGTAAVGRAAGTVIVACLAVLAVARAASSVSYKDALARTITKRRRGAITGLAPPFVVMLSAASGRSALDDLGPLMMALTAASVLASYVWGRRSDRSSGRP
ncbi:hypothetical protein ACVDG3_22350 [Meridianimarinicoccus sp. RP-17]|uniref:hypothetical protein n=1 Tax=Meridianimarinicoccus zhengii TaxID=2056810 RepID=UPI000DAE9C77|nr:hypothetical protein [Phycocomes zhengii]